MTTSVIPDAATLQTREPEIACSLAPDEQLRRAAELRRSGLFARVVETVPLSDGYRMVFAGADAEIESDVDDFVSFESKCCAFASFVTGRDGGRIWLEITGAEGTREFVESWLPQAEKAQLRAAASAGGGRRGIFVMISAVGLCCVAPALGALGLTTFATVANPWIEALSMLTFAAGAVMWWMGRRSEKAEEGDCGC
jgi:hypothetical protein